MKFKPFALAKRHLAITFIVSAFVALGVIYSVVNPIFEAPDEMWHYFYIKHIADGHGLPVQSAKGKEAWRQEGSQPPLYYLIGALATFWLDTDDASTLIRKNPHAAIGIPLADGNKNIIVHTSREGFPYRGAVLAVHIIRVLSVLMGATTVLITYLIALEVFPGHQALAAGAAALNAFNPQFIFISGAVSNDNLVTMLSSLALFLIIRLLRGAAMTKSQALIAQISTEGAEKSLKTLKPPNFSVSSVGSVFSHWSLLGFVLGLAALAKLSGLSLLLLALAALGIVALRQRSLRAAIEGGAVVFSFAALIAGWWYVRNWALYGDPLGLKVMLAIVGKRDSDFTIIDFLAGLEGLKISFWALFGWMNVLADQLVYRIFDGIALLGGVGLICIAIKRLNGGEALDPPLLISLLWLLILAASFIKWTQATTASQGRLLFPAISAISTLLFAGLAQLVPRRFTGVLAGSVAGVMLILATISPFRCIAPAYARPPLLSSFDEQTIPHRVYINYEGKVELIGYETDKDRVEPGDDLELTLYWRCLAEMDRDYSVFIHLFGRDEQPIGQRDTYPGRGTYPTSLWRAGDIICDRYKVSISPDAAAPSACRIEVGLYSLPTLEGVRDFDREGRPLGSPIIGRVKIAPEEPQSYAIPNPTYFNLADKVALVGYDLEERAVRPSDTLPLTLFWQALEKMDEDYTVFNHFIDEKGRIWGQRDSQPLDGYYPTTLWDVGEIVKDDYHLIIEDDAPAGEYQIEVGMYRLEDGERLSIMDEGGRLIGDRILLDRVRVIRP